jgi:hypothetical protein
MAGERQTARRAIDIAASGLAPIDGQNPGREVLAIYAKTRGFFDFETCRRAGGTLIFANFH